MAFHQAGSVVEEPLQDVHITDAMNNNNKMEEPAYQSAESDDEWETDLECSDCERSPRTRKKSFDVTGKTNYKRACKALGVVPASAVLRAIDSPEIKLAHHGLGPRGGAALGKGLAKSTTVERLDLCHNGLLGEGAEQFGQMMLENCYITDLKLAGNSIGGQGAQAIGTALQHNRCLETLDLSENELSDKDASPIADGLKENTVLKHLNLSHNAFCGSAGGEALGAAFAESSSLTVVNLSWNHLRLDGAIAVAKAMAKNNSITTLDLSWNGFADEGAEAMGKALKKNDTLVELDLSHNRITEKGALLLAQGLETNSTLELLKIGLNPIKNNGALALLTAIQRNPSSAVKEIEFKGVSVRRDFVSQLEDYLKLHPNFKALYEVYSGRPARRLDSFTIGSGSYSSDEQSGRLGSKNELLCAVKDFLIKKRLRAIDLFNTLDRDKTHSISSEEMFLGFKKLKVPLNDAQLKKLLRLLDKDGSGEIHYNEFVAVND